MQRVAAVVYAGKVFRTAAPLKATAEDVQRLYNDLAIKDLVRLNSCSAGPVAAVAVCTV